MHCGRVHAVAVHYTLPTPAWAYVWAFIVRLRLSRRLWGDQDRVRQNSVWIEKLSATVLVLRLAFRVPKASSRNS